MGLYSFKRKYSIPAQTLDCLSAKMHDWMLSLCMMDHLIEKPHKGSVAIIRRCKTLDLHLYSISNLSDSCFLSLTIPPPSSQPPTPALFQSPPPPFTVQLLVVWLFWGTNIFLDWWPFSTCKPHLQHLRQLTTILETLPDQALLEMKPIVRLGSRLYIMW